VFIAKIPNRGSQPTYLLRESSREGKKVRNRTLASLTHRPAQRREALGRALRGEFDHLAWGRPVCGPPFGALYAVQAVADRLGVSRALGSGRPGQPALFLVLTRLLHQGSRLSAVRRARHQAVGEVLGLDSFTEDDRYRTLDEWAARRERIEKHLYRRYVSRRGVEPPLLVLYDITSTYLEGRRH
jgi:hypothetical protein